MLHATTLRIPIVEVEGGSLTSLAGFDGHQGVAVVVDARRFASVEDILARSIERAQSPFVVVLDSLEDPQNVGTLLRSAEGVGVHGVVFPTERQAPLSPAAVKASAGATEHLLLAPVDDLAATLTDLHLRGVRIVGSEADAPMTAREADLRGPIALVVGSEGHGLSPAVRRRCDLFVRLPMRGAIGSLNAAVAGSVLLFEILGQRDAGGETVVSADLVARPARSTGVRRPPEPAVAKADVAAETEAVPELETTPEPEWTTDPADSEPAAAAEPRVGAAAKAPASPTASLAEESAAADKRKTTAKRKAATAKKAATQSEAATQPKASAGAKAAAKTTRSAAAPATKKAATNPKPKVAKPRATPKPKLGSKAEATTAAAAIDTDEGPDLLPE